MDQRTFSFIFVFVPAVILAGSFNLYVRGEELGRIVDGRKVDSEQASEESASALVRHVVSNQPLTESQEVPAPESDQPDEEDGDTAQPTAPQPTPLNFLGSRQPVRLSQAPNMFGDFFNTGGDLGAVNVVTDASGNPVITEVLGTTDLPLAAASRRVKIAENNKALPQDRIYLLYNHFHNALEIDARENVGLVRQFSVDRYTLGFEKTFRDGLWSVELRMPFAGRTATSVPFGSLSAEGGKIGNLAVLVKRLVYQDPITAVAIGLAIDTPTGSDVRGFAGFPFDETSYIIHNQAVHLSPYLGFLRVPSDIGFYQAFVQVDVPTNGNQVDVADFFGDPALSGVLNEQTLLHADFSLGYWLYRNRCACYLTGLASLLELHYTTTLQDSDDVTGVVNFTGLRFGQSANRFDILNFTVGLHAELTPLAWLRCGAVFPLKSDDDRFFDAEVQVQVERRF